MRLKGAIFWSFGLLNADFMADLPAIMAVAAGGILEKLDSRGRFFSILGHSRHRGGLKATWRG